MSKHPDSRDHPPGSSSIEGLPKFPGDADDGLPPPPLPNRARTWAIYGAIGGAICGAAGGVLILVVDLSIGSPHLLEALGILFGAPVVLASVSAAVWGVRGVIRDTMMEAHDLEQQRDAETEQEQDREWSAVKKILRQKGHNP